MRLTKYLLAGFVLFCVSWIACVSEWHAGVHWGDNPSASARSSYSTMPTIVAYSAGKQAEMDRPSPVACEQLPAFPTIPYINRTWVRGDQRHGWSSWQRVPGTGVSLYAAYYDQRLPQHYIRILAIFEGRSYSNNDQLFCQTRPQNPYEISIEVVAAKPTEIWWPGWDSNSVNVETPLLLSCPLTEPLSGPSIVSIVTQPCNYPTNAFYLKPTKYKAAMERNFTICVKDMNFDKDISTQMVEWIETNKILGADKIDIYVDRISDEVANIIEYYRNNNFVRILQVPINSQERTLWQRRRDHIITYNDCLYRNIHESQYIIPLDVDEILLPKIANNWPHLVLRLKDHGWNPTINSAILVRNVFFFDFMQGIDKYKYNNLHNNKSKIYVKRDDVRLQDFDEIELVVDNELGDNNVVDNVNNEVIDFKNEELIEEYKKRCGSDLAVPKLARHLVRSNVISPFGHYSKSLMLTKNVLTAFNHYPLASLGMTGFSGWTAPFNEVQLNHYKESCNTTVVSECARYGRRARIDSSALKIRRQLTKALSLGPCTKHKIKGT